MFFGFRKSSFEEHKLVTKDVAAIGPTRHLASMLSSFVLICKLVRKEHSINLTIASYGMSCYHLLYHLANFPVKVTI
jgi:hypothetical protein